MEATILTQMNQQLALSLGRPLGAYDSVQVLITYWAVSDNPGYQEEAIKVATLFEEDLGYPVEIFAIPNNAKCHLRLDQAINKLLDIPESQQTLLIVYYGGHGDPDDHQYDAKGGEQLSVWAA